MFDSLIMNQLPIASISSLREGQTEMYRKSQRVFTINTLHRI